MSTEVDNHLRIGLPIASIVLAAAIAASTAKAGSCGSEIARVEAALDSLASEDGSARQSPAATLHRQPTTETVERGKKRAAADEQADRTALERARCLGER